jgi:hypothetical protein
MGRLELNRRVERDRDVLKRILALLLALAALADRAAGLSAAERLRILAILGRGEAEARIFIVETVSGAPAESASPTWAAGDAARLAAHFRILALALSVMLERTRAPCRQASLPTGLPRRKPRRPEGWRAFPTLPLPDTS